MWRYVIAIVLIGHGIGHAMGFLESWARLPQGWSARPWIFSRGVTIKSPVGRVWGLIWLAALAATITAGVGLLYHHGWWRTTAIAAAVVSLVAIVPWLKAVPAGAKMGVLLDLAIIAGLLSPWGERIVRAVR